MAETGEKTNMVPPGTVSGFGVWMPIETAPKDGTPILVYHDNGEIFLENDTLGFEWEPYAGAIPYAQTPTHWMPLPEGPE